MSQSLDLTRISTELRNYASKWKPEVRLLGNLQAKEVIELCDYLDQLRHTDEEWIELQGNLWERHRTLGHQGEEFVWEGDFLAALDEARANLAMPTPVLEAK